MPDSSLIERADKEHTPVKRRFRTGHAPGRERVRALSRLPQFRPGTVCTCTSPFRTRRRQARRKLLTAAAVRRRAARRRAIRRRATRQPAIRALEEPAGTRASPARPPCARDDARSAREPASRPGGRARGARQPREPGLSRADAPRHRNRSSRRWPRPPSRARGPASGVDPRPGRSDPGRRKTADGTGRVDPLRGLVPSSAIRPARRTRRPGRRCPRR